LLLLCPTCHSKITKGDISRKKVEQVKATTSARQNIECATISVDTKNCSWDNYDNLENAFINNHTNNSEFPILNFSLINHTTKTILFKEIKLKAILFITFLHYALSLIKQHTLNNLIKKIFLTLVLR
jgi:hypothetical protein